MLITIIATFAITTAVLIATAIINRRFCLPVYKYVIVPSKKTLVYTYVFGALTVIFLALAALIYIQNKSIAESIVFYFFGLLCAIGVVCDRLSNCCRYVAFDGVDTVIVHNCFNHKIFAAAQIERIHSFRGIIYFSIKDKRGLWQDLFTIEAASVDSVEFVHALDAIAQTPDD
ncbi:MAG: hypothetical protein J6S71_02920 [Clostridia bacterium]|nr:hypothetical protein [Clostridia bacterium]